jgi:uncharacterized protein YbjT (DUF2867 family)
VTVLIFGASGSAGGAVLRVAVSSPAVRDVRAIVRRRLAFEHPKLRTCVHDDFERYDSVLAAFAGVDACLYCLGISVTQVSGEPEYRRITHDFAIAAAWTLHAHSPDAVFHFLSGQGAHLRSRFMWARVKAETERELIASHHAVCWRPAAIDGMPSASEPAIYRWVRPAYRLFSPFRSLYVKGSDIGLAMLQATEGGMRAEIVGNAGIRRLADRARAVGTVVPPGAAVRS